MNSELMAARERIVALESVLEMADRLWQAVDQYCQDALPSDRPTKDMRAALDDYESARDLTSPLSR